MTSNNTMTTTTMDSKRIGSKGTRPRREASNNSKLTAMSAAATGRTLILLAASCAAFQNGNPITPSMARTRSIASGSVQFHGRASSRRRSFDRVGTALRYRHGTEDQPIDFPNVNAAPTAQHEHGNDVSTRACADVRASASAFRWMFPARWVSSPAAATSDVDERRVAMDEYLAFIEKRRNRFRQEVDSSPDAARRSSMVNGSAIDPYCPRSTRNALSKVAAMFASSMKVATRMFLLDRSGLPGASLAIMLVFGPLLNGAFRQG